MITDLELIGLKCGDFAWMCCIPKDKADTLYQFVRTHTRADLAHILDYCSCNPQLSIQPSNQNGGGGNLVAPNTVSPADISSLTSAIGTLKLPDSCLDMKDFICGKMVSLIISGLCQLIPPAVAVSGAVQDLGSGQPPGKVYKGLLALMQFLCALYDLACHDDTAAAGFVLGWCVIDDLLARKVIDEAALLSDQPAIGFFMNDVLSRMESALSQTSCCSNLLTNNKQVVSLMQNIAGV